MRLIVGLGLERLLVVFDMYGLSSHLILHGFGCNSGNRLRPAAHLLLARTNPAFAPKIASNIIYFPGTIRANEPYLFSGLNNPGAIQ